MKIIGLTGPSGAGKGFCYSFFDSYNIPCIDTDKVYHDLLIPPSDCVDELTAFFGKGIIDNSGFVDRKILAQIVFSDKSHEKLEKLNQINHKYVLCKTKEALSEYERKNFVAAVVDAPLLFESGFDKLCDFSIAVLSGKEKRVERIMARDGLTKDAALMRVNAQKDDGFYSSMAQYTILNDTDEQALNSQLFNVLKQEHII
jgi:dephospho-CoA kinase